MLRKATTNPFGRGFVLRLSHAELALDLGRRITVTLQTENVERGLVVEKEGNQIFLLITDLKASFGIWFVGGGFRMILGQLAGSVGNSLFDHMAGVAFHDPIEVLEDADFAVPASASVQSLDDGVVEEVLRRDDRVPQPDPCEPACNGQELGVVRFPEVVDRVSRLVRRGEPRTVTGGFRSVLPES